MSELSLAPDNPSLLLFIILNSILVVYAVFLVIMAKCYKKKNIDVVSSLYYIILSYTFREWCHIEV